MSRCTHSPVKHRVSMKKSGNPSDYQHGMRGHAWESFSKDVYEDDGSTIALCVGRRCKNCGKIVLNPTGEKYERESP